MKKILLLSLFSFISASLCAQSDFREGYIITHAGDTISGWIDYREGARKYERCSFRRTEDAAVQEYTAAEIRGYRFPGGHYFISRQTEAADQTMVSVFLEVLVDGRLSLYRHEDDFFVAKGNSPLHPLRNEKLERVKDGKRVIVESNRFIGVLSYLTSDCGKLRRAGEHVRLVEKALTEVVDRYNMCKGSPAVVYKAGLPYVKASVAMAGGLNTTTLSFGERSGGFAYLHGKFQPARSLAGGILIDLSSPRINQRMAFHAGVLFHTATFYSFHTEKRKFATDRHFVTVDRTAFEIPLGLKYTLPQRKFTPYATLGVAASYNVGGWAHWIKETEIDGVVETYESDDVKLISGQFGFWGGMGIRRSLSRAFDIFLEGRYSATAGGVTSREAQSPASALPSFSSFQFLVGFRTK